MYNQTQKMEFLTSISQSETTIQSYVGFFNRIEPFEINDGTDFADMKAERQIEIFSNYSSYVYRTMRVQKSMLTRYLKWYDEKNGTNTAPGFANQSFREESSKAIRNTLYPSEALLQHDLEVVFPPIEDKTIYNLFRGAFWLVFYGLFPQDLGKVKSNDIDIHSMEINYNGEVYPFGRIAKPTLEFCKESETLSVLHHGSTMCNQKRIQSPYLLRGVKKVMTHKTIHDKMPSYTPLVEYREKTGRRALALTSVRKSGLFIRAYEAEQIDPARLASVFSGDYALSGKDPSSKSYIQYINNTRAEYRIWKATFFNE